MLRRKLAVAAAAATAAALALGGCGVGGSTSSSGKTITVLVEAGGHAELQPIADEFTKETGTKVSFVELPYDGLYNRLNSEFTSGSVSFDVAAMLSQSGEKTMVTSADGSNVTLGDKNSLQALQFNSGLAKYAPPGASQVDWAAAQNLFNQGKTAMSLFWAHEYRQIPKDSVVNG